MSKEKFESLNRQGWESEVAWIKRQRNYLVKERDSLTAELALYKEAGWVLATQILADIKLGDVKLTVNDIIESALASAISYEINKDGDVVLKEGNITKAMKLFAKAAPEKEE